MTLIAPTLQAYFSDRLVNQLHASPRTIGSLNRPGSVGDLDLPRLLVPARVVNAVDCRWWCVSW